MQNIGKMILLLSGTILLAACTPSPEEIPYGNAECEYCRMTVVDQQHAAELVTTKGKVYFFDAIECMVNFRLDNAGLQYSHALVNNFNAPGTLIDAGNAAYLISKQLPSPMGAFLSAFPDSEALSQAKATYGGTGYSWDEILELTRMGTLGETEE